MTNIPIYRARRSDSDEWVDGYLTSENTIQRKGSYYLTDTFEIDQNTLSIHFPSMIDKNGKKIFASLSEDGVGGDKIYAQTSDSIGNMSNDVFRDTICTLHNTQITFLDIIKGENFYFAYNYFVELEVIGIHKG